MSRFTLALSLLVTICCGDAFAGRDAPPGWKGRLWTRIKASYHARLGDRARGRELNAQLAAWQVDAINAVMPAGTGWHHPLEVVPNPTGRGSVSTSELRAFSARLQGATRFLSQLDATQAAALPPALRRSVQQLATRTDNMLVNAYSFPLRDGSPDRRPTEAAGAFLGAATGLVKTARQLGMLE